MTTQSARIAARDEPRYGRTKPIRSYIVSRVGALASRAFSAPTREHPPQLALVRAQLVVALLDRREQLDHGLGDAPLNAP